MVSRRIGQTRDAPPLLRMVGGKEHASDGNHEPEIEALYQKPKLQRIVKAEKKYPSPATTASGNSSQVQPIDIGSDDEPLSEDDLPTYGTLVDYKRPVVTSIEVVKDEERPAFKSASAIQKKRESSPWDEEGEPDWLQSSQPKPKKRKVIAPTTNIHATAGSTCGGRPAKAYGSASQKSADRQKKDEEKKKLKQKEKSGFRAAKKLETEGEKSPVNAFRTRQTNVFDLIASAPEESPTLSAARRDLDDLDSLSDLDDNAMSTIEEGKQYLPAPKPYVSTHKCEHCGEEVEKLLYEEFLDGYNSGKDLNFRWQRRFCNFHHKQKAQALWKERRYPTIDWSGLERRMRKHDDFLRQILRDEQDSVHRKELKRHLVPGRRSKNIGQLVMDRNVKAGTLVGYYGPRGQKAMVDHIIDHLSDDIREQAVNDDIVMASGAQGGVSGFVQSVLVPHLAEMLIKEDLYLTIDWEAEVREVIAESGELGELMNPETEDEIKEVDDDDEL